MTLLLVAAVFLLAALALERVRLERTRSALPLRVAVTGTRGKTTVARLLASVLREEGRAVLAKTTGSEPCLVLPDGSVERIRRRGPASILEQKALLRRAARLEADTVVAEVMSIHAENHTVEGRRILAPHLVLATNFLVDHTEAQGGTPESVGSVLALAVPPGAVVLVPEGLCPASFRSAVAAVGATLVEVPAGSAGAADAASGGTPSSGSPQPTSFPTFPDNLDLVVAAARRLGVGDTAIHRGIAKARHDVGALGVWTVQAEAGSSSAAGPPHGGARVHFVSAFAANDPGATLRVYDQVMARLGGPRPRCVGLLSLRADRGDRTLQWADALAAGFLDRFDALVVTGLHAAALERRVRRARHAARSSTTIRIVRGRSPERLTDAALSALGPGGGVVFGFGNIGGPGVELVEHWSQTGEAVAHGH